MFRMKINHSHVQQILIGLNTLIQQVLPIISGEIINIYNEVKK